MVHLHSPSFRPFSLPRLFPCPFLAFISVHVLGWASWRKCLDFQEKILTYDLTYDSSRPLRCHDPRSCCSFVSVSLLRKRCDKRLKKESAKSNKQTSIVCWQCSSLYFQLEPFPLPSSINFRCCWNFSPVPQVLLTFQNVDLHNDESEFESRKTKSVMLVTSLSSVPLESSKRT